MKRFLSVVLCLTLVFSLFPNIIVFATEEKTDNTYEYIVLAYDIMQKYCDPELSDGHAYIPDEHFAELKTVAEDVIKNCKTDYEKIKELCYFVADNIYYNYDYYEGRTNNVVTDAYGVYECKTTVCAGYATFYLALCNTVNIPCMILHGTNHSFNAAYDSANKRWIVLDTTWCSGNDYEYGNFVKGTTGYYYFDLSPDRMYEIGSHEMIYKGYKGLLFPYNDIFYVLSEDKTLYVDGLVDSNYSGKITIPDSIENLYVTSIGNGAFGDCSSLTSVKIGNSVTSIGRCAFYGCSSLTSVTIPDSVTSIGDRAFYYCSSLTSVTIPDSVTSIDEFAFYNCYSLTSVKIGNSVTSIGGSAFKYCSALTTVTIPDSVTSIGDYAFEYCHSLTSVTIPDSVTSIGYEAFRGCISLTSVTIPDSVTSIGDYAFYYCSSLTSITIPDSVTSIGDYAFEYCSKLTIYGKTGSCAETYAKENGIPFKKIINSSFIPKLGKVSNTSTGVKITWSAVDGAENYIVYRKSGSSGYEAIKTVSGSTTSYTDTTAKSGTKYTYTVKATNAVSKSGYDKTGLSKLYLATPAVKTSNTSKGISVEWNETDGATGYIIYRKAGSGSWTEVKDITNGSTVSFTDTTVKSGTKYSYYVKAYNGSTVSSYKSTTALLYLATPTVKTSNTSKGVSVKWNTITGAKGYYIYRKAGSGSWSKIKDVTSGSTVSFTDTSVKSGTKYSYYVKAYNGSTVSSYKSTTALLNLATPTVKTSNTSKGISVKWNKITGAKGYYVYRKSGSGKWTKVKEITSGSTVSFTDTTVKSGTKYSYYVKAYNGKTVSSYKASTALMFLKAVKLSSASSGKTGITVKWGKVSSAKGYYVYRKTGSGSYKKIATVKSGSTVKYLDKSAKKGTTYTYYVKAYNGSYTGSYLNTLKCKDKY